MTYYHQKEANRYLSFLYTDIVSAYENGMLSEFFEDNEPLDMDFTVNIGGAVIGCRIWLTLGGPAVFINTNTKSIEYRHGLEQYSHSLDSEICYAVEDFFAEGLPFFR